MKGAGKVEKVMHEFNAGTLRSGSKTGPKVTNRRQAVAIAMSEAGIKPRNRMSHHQRAMRDRSTKGSPPMEMPEFRVGYRALA